MDERRRPERVSEKSEHPRWRRLPACAGRAGSPSHTRGSAGFPAGAGRAGSPSHTRCGAGFQPAQDGPEARPTPEVAQASSRRGTGWKPIPHPLWRRLPAGAGRAESSPPHLRWHTLPAGAGRAGKPVPTPRLMATAQLLAQSALSHPPPSFHTINQATPQWRPSRSGSRANPIERSCAPGTAQGNTVCRARCRSGSGPCL